MLYIHKDKYYIKTNRGYYLNVQPKLNDTNEVYLVNTTEKIPIAEFKDYETITLGDVKVTLTTPKVKPIQVEKQPEKRNKKYKFI